MGRDCNHHLPGSQRPKGTAETSKKARPCPGRRDEGTQEAIAQAQATASTQRLGLSDNSPPHPVSHGSPQEGVGHRGGRLALTMQFACGFVL